jgi:signal transduction histidine kinase
MVSSFDSSMQYIEKKGLLCYLVTSLETNLLMLRVLIILFFSAFFLHPGTASESAASGETKRVLVLYSLDRENIGQNRVNERLQDIFGRDKTFQIKIYNEYLDLVRFSDLESTSALSDYLHRKYDREKPDVVITVLPPALDCLEQNGRKLFKGIPVIAAFIPRDRAESLAASPLHERATGIIYADNGYEIARSALLLRPGTKHLALVAGSSPIDISFKVPILREIKRAAEGRELIDLSGLTIGEILSRVRVLPQETILFYTSVFRDKNGLNFHPPDVLRLISDASNAPVFGFVESHIGKGIVGGSLSSLEWHVGKIAELTNRVLSGETSVEDPIVEEGGYRPLYDWREIKRWGIPESSLPRRSIFVNGEQSVFQRYKLFIIAALLFLSVQTFFIGFLIHLNGKQRKTSLQLREYEDRYRELLRVDRSSRLGELTASLAHELNQPLTAILSTAQAALRFLESGKNDPALYREILQNIVQDDKRAADVVRSLRSMVKKEPAKKEKVDVSEVLSEGIAITHGELIAHNVVVEPRLDASQLMVLADKSQIQQVLLNLILNAVDALDKNSRDKRTIVLHAERSDGFVRVAVQDNGTGISSENMGRVFEPFFSTKDVGLGMGLAVCKTIITEHGGRIWAEMNPQGGATFSFELKAADND